VGCGGDVSHGRRDPNAWGCWRFLCPSPSPCLLARSPSSWLDEQTFTAFPARFRQTTLVRSAASLVAGGHQRPHRRSCSVAGAGTRGEEATARPASASDRASPPEPHQPLPPSRLPAVLKPVTFFFFFILSFFFFAGQVMFQNPYKILEKL
jgi:hypothetical protein